MDSHWCVHDCNIGYLPISNFAEVFTLIVSQWNICKIWKANKEREKLECLMIPSNNNQFSLMQFWSASDKIEIVLRTLLKHFVDE